MENEELTMEELRYLIENLPEDFIISIELGGDNNGE